MKRTIILILSAMLALSTLCLSSCDQAGSSYTPYRDISVTLPPYDEVEGSVECNHNMQTVFTRAEDQKAISACTRCGYSPDGYRYFHTKEASNKFVKYEKIIIKLSSNYQNQELLFRSDVSEVVLIGTEGQTLDGLKIHIQNRTEPFTVSLCNVNVVSSDVIILSDECAAKVTVKTYGTGNSLTTRDGARGVDGELNYVDYGTAQYANAGGGGHNAANVLEINGDVDVYAFAPLNVKGGNGGSGGNGASHNRGPQYVARNNGGDGGRGGNGGSAILSGGRVTLCQGASLVTLTGGQGGNGGSGGRGGNPGGIYNSVDGSSGSKGENGKTGLENG